MKRISVALGLFALVCSGACGKNAGGTTHAESRSAPGIGTRGDWRGQQKSYEPPPPEPGADEDYALESAPSGSSVARARPQTRPRPRHRPGLGTEYGETRRSTVTTVPFTRARSQPDVTLAVWYNDFDGVRAMSGHSTARTESMVNTSDGTFVLSVVDERGNLLTAADIGAKRYVVGAAGLRYQLGIENHSSERFEVVASVDGLDVIDGEEAGFHKRGYILEPFSSVMVDGWRTSNDTVAAFRFGAIEDSYAERRGKGRNVGVIGAAFFHEEGGVAWQDLHRRHRAEPFPGRFAPPPPPRHW